MRFPSLIPLLILSLVMQARAALPLADKAPGNALLYAGWAGADALQQPYANSHLKAVLDQSNIPELAQQYLPQLWQKLSDSATEKAQKDQVAAAKIAAPLLWRHPTAFCMTPSTNAANPANVHFQLICDAGDDAPALLAALQKFDSVAPATHADRKGSLVTLIVNGEKPSDMADAPALSSTPAFVAMTKPLQSSPALAVYFDGASSIKQWNNAFDKNPNARDIWPKVRDALGLTHLQGYAWTAGFDGKDWATASFLAAPSPRTGLLAVIEPKPADLALLASVPASADSASVINFDAPGLFDVIHTAFAADPQAGAMFDKAVGVGSMLMGRNIRRQILGPLGPQWVIYSKGGSLFYVLLNKPTDPKTAQDGFVSVTYGLSNLANSQMRRLGGGNITVTADQKQVEGLTVTSIALPNKAILSWAINKDGIMAFGKTSTEVVAAANTAPQTRNITQSDQFMAMRTRLGIPVDAAGGFDYSDLAKTVPHTYALLKKAYDARRQVSTFKGLQLSEVKLPMMEQLAPRLSPAMSITWADDAGIYSRSASPFPGSFFLGNSPSTVYPVAVALATSILLPSLNRARETAKRTQCASNERQISLGLVMYASDHHGLLPPDLGSLLAGGYLLNMSIFTCPDSKTSIPQAILTGTKAQQAAWINQHGDYLYYGSGLRWAGMHDSATTPILAERDANHAPDGMYIGFADGHVEFVNMPEARKMLDTQQQKAGGL